MARICSYCQKAAGQGHSCREGFEATEIHTITTLRKENEALQEKVSWLEKRNFRLMQTTSGQADKVLERAEQAEQREKRLVAEISSGNASDGYHTHNELYEYRKQYNAAFFNQLANWTNLHVSKSFRHSDGELAFGGGWFIVVAVLPTGMISNHYKEEEWELFNVPKFDVSPIEYDGHTPAEALERLTAFNSKQALNNTKESK